MASRTSELVGRVDPAQSFDVDALLRYAIANVDGFPQSPSQFTVSQVFFFFIFIYCSRGFGFIVCVSYLFGWVLGKGFETFIPRE